MEAASEESARWVSIAQLLRPINVVAEQMGRLSPEDFGSSAAPFSPGDVAAALTRGEHHVRSYAIRVLHNLCVDEVRAHKRIELKDLSGDEFAVTGAPIVANHPAARWLIPRNRWGDSVMSPHLRAVVINSSRAILERLRAMPPASADEAELRPYIQAVIEALPLILETPELKVYTIARSILERQGHTQSDIKNQLARALKHALVQQLQRRIAGGAKWY